MKWARHWLPFVLCAFPFQVISAQTASSQSAHKPSRASTASSHKSATSASSHSKVSTSSAAHTTNVGYRSRHGKSTRKARPSAPAYQLHPDPERYQQIQQALSDRGYFKGEVNGLWGDDSVDALKRFQTDQKYPDDDGKINAPTLIGLGLGPHHNTGTSGPVSSSVLKPTPVAVSAPASTASMPGAESSVSSPPAAPPKSQ